MVPNTGILLGAPTADAASVSPLIIANPGNGEFTFAGAGGGAATAAQALGFVARGTIDDDRPLASVLVQQGGRGGFVNAIACPSGLRASADKCRAAADPVPVSPHSRSRRGFSCRASCRAVRAVSILSLSWT
jgi:gamma-glutamyltranspeptidase / glutathione hydrolase